MKLISEMLQNLPYFWNKETQWASTVKNPKLLEIKNEKNIFWFSYSKNMAHFEAFR